MTSLTLLPHVAGMSGKKADKTLVKACAQFVLGRLAARRDVDGMAAFSRDLYDVVNVELRADAIAQQKVDTLCSRIDDVAEDLDTVTSGATESSSSTSSSAPRAVFSSGFDAVVGGGGNSNDSASGDVGGRKRARRGGDMVSRVPVRVGRDANYIFLSSLKRFVTRHELYDLAIDSRRAREELSVFDAADEQDRVRVQHGGLGLLPVKTTAIRIKPFHLHTTVTTDAVARHLKGPQ